MGVTIFGVIFNRQMSAQFNRLLAPQLRALPPDLAARFVDLIARPADLVQLLLQKPLQQMLPEPMRAPVLARIKAMMAASIHPVFWTGLVVIACGVLIGQFLGRESLTAQIRRQAEHPELEETAGDGGLEGSPSFATH